MDANPHGHSLKSRLSIQSVFLCLLFEQNSNPPKRRVTCLSKHLILELLVNLHTDPTQRRKFSGACLSQNRHQHQFFNESPVLSFPFAGNTFATWSYPPKSVLIAVFAALFIEVFTGTIKKRPERRNVVYSFDGGINASPTIHKGLDEVSWKTSNYFRHIFQPHRCPAHVLQVSWSSSQYFLFGRVISWKLVCKKNRSCHWRWLRQYEIHYQRWNWRRYQLHDVSIFGANG